MSGAYASEVWKRFIENGKDLTDLPILDGQDALMAEEEEVVVVDPVVAAVPAVYNDAFLDVNEDEDWELEGAVGLEDVERPGLKRKLRELQEKRPFKRQKVSTSVAEAFTLASKLLSSADAHMFKAELATRVNRGDELKVEHQTVAEEQDRSRIASADAWMKGTREDHVHELDALLNLFKTCESKL